MVTQNCVRLTLGRGNLSEEKHKLLQILNKELAALVSFAVKPYYTDF